MRTTICDSSFGLRAVARILALAVLLRSGAAEAQAEDQAAARALFDEGRQLVKDGHYEAACPKFEAASRLYAGSGLLNNLGDCYEHTNRTASAWTVFGEAVAAAERLDRKTDALEARRRQAALEPRLCRLQLRVTFDVPGLVIRRDETLLERAAWSSAIPVDPGPHVVQAEAPNRRAWETTVTVAEPGGTVVVDVPELSETATGLGQPTPVALPPASGFAPVVPPLAVPRSSPEPYWNQRRIIGVVLGGVGLASVGAGGVLGLVAKSNYDTATGETGTARHTDSLSAVGLGNAATVVMGIGAAVAVAGVVVWLTTPRASVRVGTNGTAMLIRGTF